jgi:glycosyltransferase involved in cell wall biosynthesis
MAAQYRGADILVHPSVGETFGYVYFEAADAGLPVVSLGHRVAHDFIPTLVPGLLCNSEATDLAEKVLTLAGGSIDRDLCRIARAERADRLDSALARKLWVGLAQQVIGGVVRAHGMEHAK